MDDRRKFFRFESPLGVKYISQRREREGKSLTNNISKEGVAFPADSRLAKREKIMMEFDIPGDNIPVFATGVVTWVKHTKAEKKRPFNIGIKLTKIAGADRSRILEYAYKKWIELKRWKEKE